MNATLDTKQFTKGHKGVGMEGSIARWYARNTEKHIEDYRKLARMLAGNLKPGSSVLEVAPGPGYLAIELALAGQLRIVGVDISKTFVAMATASAHRAGVAVEFVHGNASELPFEDDSFDLVVCRAAFKNFTQPVKALGEMCRVLKPGGEARIFDLKPDASPAAIGAEVERMNLSWVNSLMTRFILRSLTRRAHSKEAFRAMAAQTPFKSCVFHEDSIGFDVSFKRL